MDNIFLQKAKLSIQIEQMKKKLNSATVDSGFNLHNKEVIHLSNRLDTLLNEYAIITRISTEYIFFQAEAVPSY